MRSLKHAKALRIDQTEAEQRLWYHLRAHRFMQMKFKRQKPIGPFIVDFICHESNLIIEVDGGQHQDNFEYDQRRDAWLTGQGYIVLRFWNNDVLQQTESVLEAIRLVMQRAPSPPTPLPQAGEGRNAQESRIE
jgi:very-short-patch-repair endonuclease